MLIGAGGASKARGQLVTITSNSASLRPGEAGIQVLSIIPLLLAELTREKPNRSVNPAGMSGRCLPASAPPAAPTAAPAITPAAAPPSCAGEDPDYHEEHDRADGRVGDQRKHPDAEVDAQPRQQPIADERADDAYDQIPDEAKAPAIDDLSCQPTGDNTDDHDDEQALV